MKLIFLHADKHETLLQIDSIILMGMAKYSQSSQNGKFAMSLQYLKKKVKLKFIFLHANKHQNFLKVYFNTLGIKISYNVDIIIINGHDQTSYYKLVLCFLMEVARHVQNTQNRKLVVFF